MDQQSTIQPPKDQQNPDIAIVGGGLAGLALSIQLARAGYSVAVFEKEKYPFHKVCGEYISLESWNFLEELGLPLSDWNLPMIRRVQISAPDGREITQELPLGGFGISRYKIDSAMADIARSAGVLIYPGIKVTDILYHNQHFDLDTTIGPFKARLVCGAFGKRSNLDVKWKRAFTRKKSDALNNYIAVKRHVRLDFPADLIALHNFSDGYCGISRIEDDQCCICYMTTAANLQANGNSLQQLETAVLSRNPFLRELMSTAVDLYEQPLTISQISFEKKPQVEDHIIFVGDAAGMIVPLCGNGMSMALHGSKIAFKSIDAFMRGSLERYEMEQEYTDQWNRQFGRRLWIGRILQTWFGSERRTNYLIRRLQPFPKLVRFLIRQTHGQPF